MRVKLFNTGTEMFGFNFAGGEDSSLYVYTVVFFSASNFSPTL